MNREMVEKALSVCEKNAQLFKDIDIYDFACAHNEVKKMLYTVVLREDYGIKGITKHMVQSAEPNVHVRLNDYANILSMGAKYNRKISWPVDGRQPKDEIMYMLSFPTGAYIFGESYPVELFSDMWNEIKTYNFKYVDEANKNIYFAIDEAAPIANEFQNILQKYHKRFRDEANLRRIAELKCELKKLESAL